MDWKQRYASTQRTLEQAVAMIPKGTRVFIGSGAAEPVGLVEELVAQHHRFADNRIVHLLTLGPAPYTEARYRDAFRHDAFFIGANVRQAVHEGRADYIPVFLSQIPNLIRRRRTPVDVALVQVSPPDRFGYVNLGVSVDIVLAAVESAKIVIAEINPNMPTIFGSGFVPMDRIDAWIDRPSELPTHPRSEPDEVARNIGAHIATLVEDGSTLQIGIGEIPDAVLDALADKSDLGVWTEMMPDGLVDLIKAGNVTGRYKTIEPKISSVSFTFGSKSTYDFVDRNPAVAFHPSDIINDPGRVARQHKMVAINAALQIDLTGQVCSDSLGTKFYSGIGGQVDFIRGASMCPGGKPIIAVRSTAKGGEISRIAPVLTEGAGVVTSRGDVRFVVTEYGVADLMGKSVRQRAMALISIAHPDHRTELLDAAKQRHYVFPDQITPRDTVRSEDEKTTETEDGRSLLLRPVRETDEDDVQRLFYSLSPDTIRLQWPDAAPAMHHRDLMRYLELDDLDHVALVAETVPTDEATRDPELVGLARYHTNPADGFAEVAIVIRDDWQRRGLGTALLEHLADIAERNGIPGFTAKMVPTNVEGLQLFRRLRRSARATLDGHLVEVRVPLLDATSGT